jgi:tRNA U38,U39,U40 pseudouridine synthase TruA
VESNVKLDEKNVFQREKLLWSVKEKLDLELIRRASQEFVGTHNFWNFSRKNPKYDVKR